jgi:hypothetical protein
MGFLGKFVSSLPPIVVLAFEIAVGVIFIIGFSKHGMEFLKYGFKQTSLDESLERRMNEMEKSFEQRIDSLHTELDTIKVNHFGHLKSYLEILDGILLDKNIISNKEKAMLDSQLQGMYSPTNQHKK